MISLTRLIEQRVRFADSRDERGSAGDARRSWPERRALLVVVEDGEGNVGLGEAAPLPDYSPDSLDEAFGELAPLVGVAPGGARAPESLRELRSMTAPFRSSSVRFAVESALIELAAKRRNEPAWAPLARFRAELAQGAVVSAGMSNAAGEFRLMDVPAGTYSLVVRQPGFAETRIAVRVETQDLTIPLRLSVQPQSTEVTVTAELNSVVQPEDVSQRINLIPETRIRERQRTVTADIFREEVGLEVQHERPVGR